VTRNFGRPASTARRLLASLIFPVCAATACSRGAGADQWDPRVIRAVARQVEGELSGERLVVLHSIGGPGGAELPWAARQSLATAGIEVGDTTALRVPAVAVLVFEQARAGAGEWQVTTRLLGAGVELAGDGAPSRRWRVRCGDQQCTAQPLADAEPVSHSQPARQRKQA
jgi:hypothetical protein